MVNTHGDPQILELFPCGDFPCGLPITLIIKLNLSPKFSCTTKPFQATHVLVKLQELAIDAAKTGWHVKDDSFQAFQEQFRRPRRPHWLRPGGGSVGTPSTHSGSALGQLFDLKEEHEKWMEAWARVRAFSFDRYDC